VTCRNSFICKRKTDRAALKEQCTNVYTNKQAFKDGEYTLFLAKNKGVFTEALMPDIGRLLLNHELIITRTQLN
jgi:hypothetical protein